MSKEKTPIYDENGELTDYGKSIGASPVPPNEMAKHFFSMLKGEKGDQGLSGKNGEDGKDGKNGEDGKDGENGLSGMPGENGSSDTPEEMRDKLESLVKGKKISIQAIENLADILEKFSKQNIKAGEEFRSSTSFSRSRDIVFIDDETPSGTVDGVNTIFNLAKAPIKNSLKVYRGGARQRITEDYTLSGNVITFLIAPQVGEILLVDYRQK